MAEHCRTRRAFLSVWDKAGIVEFARGLAARGFELVSTAGTAGALEAAGLAVVPVSTVTGFPEIMGGRVKALHPLVCGGILARRSSSEDLAAVTRYAITVIDVVAVNLYPLAQIAINSDIATLVNGIDVGGPTLVRAAAKNFEDVIVVVSPDDYPAVLDQFDRAGGPTWQFRCDLAGRGFAYTAAYDAQIAAGLMAAERGADQIRT